MSNIRVKSGPTIPTSHDIPAALRPGNGRPAPASHGPAAGAAPLGRLAMPAGSQQSAAPRQSGLPPQAGAGVMSMPDPAQFMGAQTAASRPPPMQMKYGRQPIANSFAGMSQAPPPLPVPPDSQWAQVTPNPYPAAGQSRPPVGSGGRMQGQPGGAPYATSSQRPTAAFGQQAWQARPQPSGGRPTQQPVQGAFSRPAQMSSQRPPQGHAGPSFNPASQGAPSSRPAASANPYTGSTRPTEDELVSSAPPEKKGFMQKLSSFKEAWSDVSLKDITGGGGKNRQDGYNTGHSQGGGNDDAVGY